MERSILKGKYKIESGTIIEFVIDIDIAKEYGLEESLRFFISATEDFVKCSDLSFDLNKAKVRQMSIEESKLKKQLVENNTKGLEKIRKVNTLIKGVPKRIKDSKELRKLSSSRVKELKEIAMALDLSPIERKFFEEEFANVSNILETEGMQGIHKHLINQFRKLEKVLSDPIKAWKHHSPSAGGAIVIVIIIILVFGGLIASPRRPRYLGNTNTKEIHDLDRVKLDCKISDIKKEHIVYFKTLEEAENAMETQGFNGCYWCMRKYHTD
ncbi:MAG: hypothetical protein ACFE9L_20550 [Candidatus Hodarchaeota archaeon]